MKTSIFASLVIGSALMLAPRSGLAQPRIPDACKTGGFAIGCQAYSFNGYRDSAKGFKGFSLFEAIEKAASAGGKVIEFYPGQSLSPEEPGVRFDHNAAPDVCQKVKDKLAKHGLTAVNYGVVGIPKNEADARKIFEFAKAFELYGVTTESADAIDTIERLVKEYNVAVGFHNHPRRPSDPNYKVWDPHYILELVKDRDARIGACADTGHWARSGLRPVDCLRILKGRIISSHLKDLNEFGKPNAHDVPFGTGVCDIPAVLDELKAQGFAGNISIEYEHNWERSVPEIAQCIGFVRGYGRASK
jgi:sugar phosphate isomerase/epimerase